MKNLRQDRKTLIVPCVNQDRRRCDAHERLRAGGHERRMQAAAMNRARDRASGATHCRGARFASLRKERDVEDAASLHASRNCRVRPPGGFAKIAPGHCRVVAVAEPSNRSCLAHRHQAELSFRRRSFAASARRAGFVPFAQAISNRLQGPYATPAARFVGVRRDVRDPWGKSFVIPSEPSAAQVRRSVRRVTTCAASARAHLLRVGRGARWGYRRRSMGEPRLGPANTMKRR